MSSNPLVSCVIIFLNAERFIQEAIESVYAQTYDKWELLLVDDGSTDDSTQIALHYAEQYPEKVRYLNHPSHQNRGMSASRNLGISHAKGAYVAFLDADDVWLPNALQRQVAILGSNPEAGMVLGSAQYWYSWTGRPEDVERDFIDSIEKHYENEANTVVGSAPWITALLRDGGAAPCICSILMRREIVECVGGFEEEFRGQYEDQALFVKVSLRSPVLVVGECWSRYRQHPQSSWAIAQKTGQHHSVRLYFLKWLAEYLHKQRIKDTEIWKLLQREKRILQVHVYVREREWKRAIRAMLVLLRYHPRRFPIKPMISRCRRELALQGKLQQRIRRLARRGLPVRVRRWLRTLWLRQP